MDVQGVQTVLSAAPRIVEGVDHHRHPLLPVTDVKLRPANVVTNGQADLHASDVVRHQAIADRVVLLVAPGAEAFVVAVGDSSLRVNEIETIRRLGLRVQEMGRAKDQPQPLVFGQSPQFGRLLA